MTARQTYQTSVAAAASAGVATQNSNAAQFQLGLLKGGADARAQNLAAMTFQVSVQNAKDALRATGDLGAT